MLLLPLCFGLWFVSVLGNDVLPEIPVGRTLSISKVHDGAHHTYQPVDFLCCSPVFRLQILIDSSSAIIASHCMRRNITGEGTAEVLRTPLQRKLATCRNHEEKRQAYLKDYRSFLSKQQRAKIRHAPTVKSILKRSGFTKTKDRFHAVVKTNKADPTMKRVLLTNEQMSENKCAWLGHVRIDSTVSFACIFAYQVHSSESHVFFW